MKVKKTKMGALSDIDTNVDTLEYNAFVDIVSRSVSMCKHSTALRVDALGQVAEDLHRTISLRIKLLAHSFWQQPSPSHYLYTSRLFEGHSLRRL